MLANDWDPDDNPPDGVTVLSAIKVTDPSDGTIALNEDGSFTYTPNSGFSGSDSFTYQASDGDLESNIATVTINVLDSTQNSPPTISIDDVSVNEDEGTATFTVSLSHAEPNNTIRVDYATSAGSATVIDDFQPNSGTIEFALGETEKEITVDIVDDNLEESDESFTVELSNPQNATIDDGQWTGTILDDDHAPVATRIHRTPASMSLRALAL